MGKVNKELWLLLSLVVIAAILNFVVSSQRVVLSCFFLPTLYSAYNFGRRHATLTACFSVLLVALLTYTDPTLFRRHIAASGENPWSDLAVWGGILVATAYAMGTLHERSQKSLNELKGSYGGMLAIVQHFLTNEKYSQAHSYRVSLYATKIAESLGLGAESIEDVHTAALLRNVIELGIGNEVLYKAANLSEEELEQGMRKKGKARGKVQTVGGSLRRAILVLVAEQKLAQGAGSPLDAPLEVQVLALAEAYEALISGAGEKKMSPAQAEEIIVKQSRNQYDSMVMDAFVKAFGQSARGVGA